MNKILISLVSLILLCSSLSFALNPDSCDVFEGLKCAATLGEAVKSCKENKDFSKCYNDLKENKDCIHCTCKVFPQYCSEKSGDIDENGPTNPFSKVKINKEDTHFIDIRKILLAAVQCDPTLFDTCQDKLKKIGGECLLNSSKPTLECVKEEVAKTECNTCLCKLMPNICSKEEIEQIEKQKDSKKTGSAPNISDLLLGGLMQSGINSESLKSMLTDGKAKENVTNLLQNKDIQDKLKDLLNNDQIKSQLKNLVSSNPEEVSKVAQNIAESKQAHKAVQDFSEIIMKKEEEKAQEIKKQNQEEEKKQAKLECNHSLKNKCQFEFIKLLKNCPSNSDSQKACVYTKLSGSKCEACICTFIKNIC